MIVNDLESWELAHPRTERQKKLVWYFSIWMVFDNGGLSPIDDHKRIMCISRNRKRVLHYEYLMAMLGVYEPD
jgi:hypothetical protein